MNNANEGQPKSEPRTPSLRHSISDVSVGLLPISLLTRSSFLSRDGELALGRIPHDMGHKGDSGARHPNLSI
jgi:hypothetical protein